MVMKKFLFLLLILFSLHASASSPQSHAAIRDTAMAFALAQTKGIPGKVSIQVDDIDKRVVLRACSSLEAFLPAGAQLNGNSTVGVRCNDKKGWSVFVPVTVKISVNLLTTNKTLQQGKILTADDLGQQASETLQPGTLTDPSQAIGKVIKFGVGKGQLLRQDMLRDPYTVYQGQTVPLQVTGQGFSIRSEGKALNNAAEGQVATARTAAGQTVSGTVRDGVIEVKQ